MTGQTETSDAGPFDFYAAHFARFDSALARALRLEVYGEDLGQTGWRTGAEQVEIAEWLRLGPGVRLLDVCCGSGGPSLALAVRTGCHVTGLDVEPVGVARARAAAEGAGWASGRSSWPRTAAAGCRSPTVRSTPSPASTRSTTCPTAWAPCANGPAC